MCASVCRVCMCVCMCVCMYMRQYMCETECVRVCMNVKMSVRVSVCVKCESEVYVLLICAKEKERRVGTVSESAKVNAGTEERVELRTGLATCLQVHLHLAGSPAHGLRELSRNSNTWSLLSNVHADYLSSMCNVCTLHVKEVWCIPVVISAYTPNCC